MDWFVVLFYSSWALRALYITCLFHPFTHIHTSTSSIGWRVQRMSLILWKMNKVTFFFKCFYCFVMLCMSNSMKSFLKIMAIRSFFSVLGNLGDWKFKGNRLWANKRYYNFHYGKRQEFEFIKFLEYSFQRVFLPASV